MGFRVWGLSDAAPDRIARPTPYEPTHVTPGDAKIMITTQRLLEKAHRLRKRLSLMLALARAKIGHDGAVFGRRGPV